jgi:DNA-binding MarR family transcriptional regulator
MSENSESSSKSRIEALAQFRYALRRFLHFSEEAATEAGLTPQQHQLLLQIQGTPQSEVASIGYLAERLVLRHNSVVELSNRCEKAGLVTRTSDPANRRHVVLRLTAQGEGLLQSLSDAHANELHELGPRLVESLHAITDQTVQGTTERASDDAK